MNKIKHTNQMTTKEIVEQIEELQRFAAHVDPELHLRLQNLRRELNYRKTLVNNEVL